MAEAYFGEGGKHRRYHKASHTASGRRRKVASAEGEGFFDDFKTGFKSVFDPIGKPLLSLLPYGNIANAGLSAVGLGRPRRSHHSRLAHHELGFQGLGDGDLDDVDYFEGGSRHRRGAEGDAIYHHRGLRPAVIGAEGDAMYHHYAMGDAHTGGRRKHHILGAEGDAHTGGRKHHRRGAEGDAHTGGRKHRKPSARNLIVRKVMAERGCSLPEASAIVKREGLY
jgi:hypothetical protein